MGSPEGEEIIVLSPPNIDIHRISDLFHRNSKIYTAIIIGECEIHYQGRASSKAPLGTRIVIYKPDGSLLVHEGKDRDPLNWQPPGSLCTSEIDKGFLEIRCSSRKYGYEQVMIRFKRILAAIWCRLSTKGLEIYGTEKDLVEMIYMNPSVISPSAKVIGKEVETPSGKIDLILRDDSGNIYVVEVKNEKAGISAVNQLDRYVKHLESMYSRSPNNTRKVIGVLVSSGITRRAREALIERGYIYIDSTDFKISNIGQTLMKYIKYG